jgi:hypothetical protein
MTDGGAAFQPGTEELGIPFRARATYAGYRVFGSGDGAVLLDPKVTRELRNAAEFATQERRVTGGLLFGHVWGDDEGRYLVIDGFVEGGPGENHGDRVASDGTDSFTLSDADLRLLLEDAERMYSASVEAGWWRTLAGLGEFGPRDFATQAELVGPGGVGLLVYGSGVHWGTAYLGPDGAAPDSAGTLAAAPAPGPPPGPAPAAGPAGEPVVFPEVVDLAAGEALEPEPLPGGAGPTATATRAVPPPRVRARRSAVAPVRAAARRLGARATIPDQGPETPADVQFVVGALIVVIVAAAIIIGVLVHSALVTVIIGVVGVLVILGTVWFARR